VFTTCHPVLAPDARVALTPRLLGGLTTGEIVRAFLVAEATVAQRIVRAKRALAAAHVPLEVPAVDDRADRLDSVLEVICLLLPSVRGDLLEKLGRLDEAHAELERAASLTHNERQRALLLERAGAVSPRCRFPK
jgi:predicted RNA polymerase sigma factor